KDGARLEDGGGLAEGGEGRRQPGPDGARLHSGEAAEADGNEERQSQRHARQQQGARQSGENEVHHGRLEAEGLAEVTADGGPEEGAELFEKRTIDTEVTAVLVDDFGTREDGRTDARGVAGGETQHDEHRDGDQPDDD